jgi:hypothetical protein
VIRDFAVIWRTAEKIVYSRTLQTVSSARTRIECGFDPDAIRRLKETSEADMTIGGAELAGQAIAADLVDECHLFLGPVLVGGGKRASGQHPCAARTLGSAPVPTRRRSPPLPHERLTDTGNAARLGRCRASAAGDRGLSARTRGAATPRAEREIKLALTVTIATSSHVVCSRLTCLLAHRRSLPSTPNG